MSLALTGAGASPSKVINTALDIWRDDVNAKGGLLGRPVELVIYDDQSSPANVPNIYTKLLTVDKVDLAARTLRVPTMIAAGDAGASSSNNKLTIGMHGDRTSTDKFHYPRYFSMVSTGGHEGANSPSRAASFELAAAQNPKPEDRRDPRGRRRVRSTCRPVAAREADAKKLAAFKLVYDKSYPPSTDRLRTRPARGPGHQSRHLIYVVRLSAG